MDTRSTGGRKRVDGKGYGEGCQAGKGQTLKPPPARFARHLPRIEGRKMPALQFIDPQSWSVSQVDVFWA